MQRSALIAPCALSIALAIAGTGCDNTPQLTRNATPLSASQGGAQIATGLPQHLIETLHPGAACAPLAAVDFTGALERTLQYPSAAASIHELAISEGELVLAGSAASAELGPAVALTEPAGFVAKLDPDGHGVWLRQLTSASGLVPDVRGLTTGGEGQVTATAVFQHALELDGASILETSNPADVGQALVSLDRDGAPLWYSPYLEDTLTTFEPLGGQFTVSGSLLVRRDFEGLILWASPLAVSLSPDAWMRPLRVRSDAEGNVLVAADYFGQHVIGTRTLATDGGWGSLAAKYGPSGEPLWFHSVGGAGMLTGIDADASGNVVVVGRSPDLPRDAPSPRLLVAKYDASGAPVFARTWELPSWSPWQLVVGPWGDIVLAGQVDGSFDLGSGVLAVDGSAIAISRLDPCGNPLWVRVIDDGAPGLGGALQKERPGLDVDPQGQVWLGTSFSGTVTALGVELQASAASTEDVLLIEIGK